MQARGARRALEGGRGGERPARRTARGKAEQAPEITRWGIRDDTGVIKYTRGVH
jgi:hypothetical protein